MRFATFNIASGRSIVDDRFDAARFSDAIAALDADVVALQEVDRDQRRSDGVDLTAVAAEAMGTPHRVFAPTLYGTPGQRWAAAGDRSQDGPAYGCALVSRLPLSDVRVVRMPAVPLALPLWFPDHGVVVAREEPRVAIVARVELTGSRTVTVVGTHLAFVPGWNRRQLRRIVEEVRGTPGPVLLLGDLNLRNATPAAMTGYRALATGPSFPANRPRFQLDHILLRGPVPALGVVTGSSTPALAVSDHRPVVVDVDTA